jgi:hypothetical protein
MQMGQILPGFCCLIMLAPACSRSAEKGIVSARSDGTWSLEMGDARLVVDPQDGAKDVSLLLGETEYLTGKAVRKEFYGSSLWIAPQDRFWPQPEALDFGTYTVVPVRNGIACTSLQDENGLVYRKEITVDADHKAFVHRYTITNHADSSILLAAWEVTRHQKQGISLFPQGDASAPGTRYLDASIPMTISDGMVWHAYDLSQIGHPGHGSKAIMDGRDGWIAYVFGGYAVVKVFKDVLPVNSLPGEQDTEIYVDSRFDYIEIEVLSEKTALAPGDVLEWKVEWRILRLPSDMETNPGSKELPAYIQAGLP